MVAFPLSILALAAGVYLLVKVKREFLGGIFEILSWLVIVLSLVSVGFLGYKSLRNCGGGHCKQDRECRIEKRIILNDGGGHCKLDSASSAHCPMMDSLGKEECMKKCNEAGLPCCAEKKDVQCAKKCEGEKKACCKH